MPCACRAGGELYVLLGIQSFPSHTHVSLRTALPVEPPKRMMFWFR